MKHADEGILHAYLDRELSPDEVKELERHLSVCAPCRALLAEARGFLAESDAMVLALDMPASGTPRRLLRRTSWSTLAWAAMVFLALGTGYALRPAFGPQAAENVVSDQGVAAIASPPAAPMITTAPTPQPERRNTPIASKSAERQADLLPSAAAGAAGSGNDVAGHATPEERADVTTLANSATPTPPATAPTALALESAPVGAAQAPSRLTYIDGTPVDSTAPTLNFGPRTTAAPKRITLDEAVTHLGGTIRLIDGLAPQRVELLSGVDVAGADPDREVVRVYYEEPDLGLVTLDQQRPGPSFAARDSRDAESQIDPARVTLNQSQLPRASGAMRMRAEAPTNNVSWRTDGVWLSLSTRVTGEALTRLQARVK